MKNSRQTVDLVYIKITGMSDISQQRIRPEVAIYMDHMRHRKYTHALDTNLLTLVWLEFQRQKSIDPFVSRK